MRVGWQAGRFTMNYKVTTPPAREPLSLEDTKGHLKVDIQEDDILISNLIAAAREYIEIETQRKLIDTGVLFTLDEFPNSTGACGCAWDGYIPKSMRGADKLMLPLAPISAVTAFTYVDENGTGQTVDPGFYVLNSPSPNVAPFIEPVYGNSWPAVRSQSGAVQFTATVGYGATPAYVPQVLKQAMRLLIGAWYAFREEISMGAEIRSLPAPVAAQNLIIKASWRVL